jgi:hypothetical protein
LHSELFKKKKTFEMEENQAKGERGTASKGLTLKCVCVLHSGVGSWPYPQTLD